MQNTHERQTLSIGDVKIFCARGKNFPTTAKYIVHHVHGTICTAQSTQKRKKKSTKVWISSIRNNGQHHSVREFEQLITFKTDDKFRMKRIFDLLVRQFSNSTSWKREPRQQSH